MKTIDSKTSAFRAIRVVGICFLVVICAMANNTVCAQDVDYSDCIPFGVSTDLWMPTDTVSIKIFEISDTKNSDSIYWIRIMPYCLKRKNDAGECEIIICSIEAYTNIPNQKLPTILDPTGHAADLRDTLDSANNKDIISNILNAFILGWEENMITRTVNQLTNGLDLCDMGLDTLYKCGEGPNKVAYQVFNASCRSEFHWNHEYGLDGRWVSFPCSGSGYCRYKYEYCSGYDEEGYLKAMTTRTMEEDNPSACSEEYISSASVHRKCYSKACFHDVSQPVDDGGLWQPLNSTIRDNIIHQSSEPLNPGR